MKIQVLDKSQKRVMNVTCYDGKFPTWLHSLLRENNWHCIVTFLGEL